MFVKSRFLVTLNSLLESRLIDEREIYKKTSINRHTLSRILDEDKDAIPNCEQALELCTLLNTTINYLLEGKGPERASPDLANEMIDIMEAYSDHQRPDISIIIDTVINTDNSRLLLIRNMLLVMEETWANQESLAP